MGGYCRRWDNNITILLWMLSNHIDLSLLGSFHLSLPHSLFHPFIFCSGSHTLNPISLTNHLSICLSNLNEAIPKWPQENHPSLSLSLSHTHTHPPIFIQALESCLFLSSSAHCCLSVSLFLCP